MRDGMSILNERAEPRRRGVNVGCLGTVDKEMRPTGYPNTSSATSTFPNGALTCTPCTVPLTC
jgi:hypothetical protein